MAAFDLDKRYIATYSRYQSGRGYVAEVYILLHGKPVETFEAHGRMLPDMEKAVWAMAERIHRRLAKPR